MPRYLVTRQVSEVHGSQTYSIEADNPEQAAAFVNEGRGSFETEDLEVTDSEDATADDVEEIKDTE